MLFLVFLVMRHQSVVVMISDVMLNTLNGRGVVNVDAMISIAVEVREMIILNISSMVILTVAVTTLPTAKL